MSNIRDTLRVLDAREDRGIDTCTTCPKLCRWACPVAEAEARETTSPWALVTLAGLEKRGLAPPEVLADLAYHCTGCGACTEACLHHNDVPLWIELARRRVLQAGLGPAAISELRGHFAVAQNPQGRPLEAALEALRAREPAALDDGPTWLFPGCDALASDGASAFLHALVVRGLGTVALPPAVVACCGQPLLAAGDVDGFRAHAERWAERARHAERIVVLEPSCAETLVDRYRDVGVSLAAEVVDAMTYLADRLQLPPEDGSLGARATGDARPATAYLDTCALARKRDLVSRPRGLVELGSGAAPCELSGGLGRSADCCGAGLLLPEVVPATARALGEARLEAFRKSGARALVVASPRCAAHLSRIDPSAPIVDPAALLARLP